MRILAAGAFLLVWPSAVPAIAQEPDSIKWEASLEKSFERAKKEDKPVLASFTRRTG